ncbi:BppU family phage baseplate upper protein [Enterococcus casseliflavus]|uniref:BppU family phage baseplate upper protein n=1 Tax=Enterococcus casseliflavus TaxID=37734 RepID=UPI001883AB32|nr:BppU family phage baseplate upper protein [Enterococcus casseliflavus]MBE9899657.1 hypothetical protein [Enterococcus casseliflavus]MBE9902943.1 hypothetical protein [Enterococcus casseliflavus]MBE9923070.1 hypothetical protein [Enterococcus casseliflavus]
MSLTNFKNADLTINNINTTYIPKQYASEGDYLGRTLTVQITDDGLIGRIDGAQLVLHWKNIASGLSDDSAFTLIDAEKAIFRIEYPQNMLTPGTVKANILVIYQGKTTVSREFEITVANVAGQSTGVLAKAEFSALVAILADSNKFRTDIDTMNATKANKTELKVVEDKADENIAKLQGDLTSEIGIKVDKNGSGQVTWANLAQDARNNISGNKVATVGTDSVLEGSITDGAVTLPKIGFNPFNVVRYEHLNFEERKIGYDKNACLTLNEELSGRALHSYQIQVNKNKEMVKACKVYFRLETSSDSARVYFAPYDQNDIVVANLLGFSTNDIRIDYYRVKEGVLSQNTFTSVPLNTTFDAVKNGFSITLAVSGSKLLTYFDDKLVSVNEFASVLNGQVASAGIALRGTLNANSHIERAKVASVTNPYMFFSLDDTISILKDLTENSSNYTSIFNNEKLGFLKSMHDDYGAVFTLLLFNEDSDGWDISSTTNKYRLEFAANSHWLKFGFHSQKSDVNYAESTGDDFVSAYSICMAQIRRFATDANIDTIPRVQNFSASKAAQLALKSQFGLFNGLHGADDNRASNAGLSGAALSLLQTNDDYYDIENDLYYLRSETRLDGKNSADVIDLLNTQFYDTNNNRIYNMFFHETTLHNLSTQGAVRAAAKWAFDKRIRFDFPMHNVPRI